MKLARPPISIGAYNSQIGGSVWGGGITVSGTLGGQMQPLPVAYVPNDFEHGKGEKVYEMKNHLGNVLLVTTDLKLGQEEGAPDDITDYYLPEMVGASEDPEEYAGSYPFGMAMSGRTWQGGPYRYGFNGKEADGEWSGEGNSYDFGARVLDVRLGRWMSVDHAAAKFSSITPYAYVFSNPIRFTDPDGNEGTITIIDTENEHSVTLETTVFIVGKDAARYQAQGFLGNGKFSASQLVKDKTVEGKVWQVTINVHIVYNEQVDNFVQARLANGIGITQPEGVYVTKAGISAKTPFQPGDNLLQVDNSIYTNASEGGAGQGGWKAFVKNDYEGKIIKRGSESKNFKKTAIHEIFHLLGFDERYNVSGPTDHPDFEDDYLGAFGPEEELSGMSLHLAHFVDLLDFSLSNFSPGKYLLGNGFPGMEKSTPLQIDDTDRGNKEYDQNQIDERNNRIISR
jgi:RHS repeat-associated protein